MEWLNRSELVAGKVLSGDIKAGEVEPWIMHEPYDKLIIALQDGRTNTELYDIVGLSFMETAKITAKKMNGDVDEHQKYIRLCKESALRVSAGTELAPIVRRWKNGTAGEDDIIEAKQILTQLGERETNTVPLSHAKDVDVVWRKTNWDLWDKHFFGLPDSSVTVIGAPPGTGKTSLLGKMFMQGGRLGKSR